MSEEKTPVALMRDISELSLSECRSRIADLETENIEIRESLANKVSAATMLTGLAVNAGNIHIGLEGGVCHLLAEAFAQEFREFGGINYLEVYLRASDGLDLIVTIQKKDGKTPHQLRREAEEQLAEVSKDAGRWHQALRYVGVDRSPALGNVYFVLRNISTIPGVDLMRGSVADHFTDAIDAAMGSAT